MQPSQVKARKIGHLIYLDLGKARVYPEMENKTTVS